jgi:hypothetical protein
MVDSSILVGADDVINSALRLSTKYEHKETCQLLSKGPEPQFDVEKLIHSLLVLITNNWDKRESRSAENWRLVPKNINFSKDSKSLEVILERLIARTPDPKWVNQVPVASGLTESGGGRRAIDLVHQCGDRQYEFIELKINEDAGSPLFAAMEILQYGVLYIFSRENADTLGYDVGKGLLGASEIHLKVLAPSEYYKDYELSWLDKSINRGLEGFLRQPERGFKMDFKFEALSLIPTCTPAIWGVRQ